MERLPLSAKSHHTPLPIGTPFNFLRINSLPFVYQHSPYRVRYECLCTKCNGTSVVKHSHLKVTKSCGCITKRQGPKICKVCGISELETKFPSNNFLLCNKHELERNKPIRKRANLRWQARVVDNYRNFLLWRLQGLRQRYKKQPNKICTVTIDDLTNLYETQNGRCAISGIPMTCKRHDLYAISVDRKDNKKGYEPDNVQLTCLTLNLARREHQTDELKKFLDTYYQLRCSEKESS